MTDTDLRELHDYQRTKPTELPRRSSILALLWVGPFDGLFNHQADKCPGLDIDWERDWDQIDVHIRRTGAHYYDAILLDDRVFRDFNNLVANTLAFGILYLEDALPPILLRAHLDTLTQLHVFKRKLAPCIKHVIPVPVENTIIPRGHHFDKLVGAHSRYPSAPLSPEEVPF